MLTEVAPTVLVVSIDRESQLQAPLESLVSAGWNVVLAHPDENLAELQSREPFLAVIVTPPAVGMIPQQVLEQIGNSIPILVDALPVRSQTHLLLDELAGKANLHRETAGEQAPGAVTAESIGAVSELPWSSDYQAQLFHYITLTSPDFLYLFNLNGQFLYANPRLLTVWGRKLEDVIGKNCLDLGYEQWHHDMHMREIAEVIETRQPIKGEVPFRAPLTGIYGLYEYIFTPVLKDGNVEVIVGTTRDITARRATEDALRQSKELLEVAITASGTGTFRWDPRTDEFLAMDKSFREIFGLVPGEEVSSVRDIYQYVHPDDVARLANEFASVSEGRDMMMEFRVLRPDGTITWVFDRAIALRDDSGSIVQVIGACTDITKLKQTELELRAVERQREFIMDSMPQKIFVTSATGEVIYRNSIWTDYTGLTNEEMNDWQLFIFPEDLPRNNVAWNKSLRTGEPFSFEHRFLNRDGQYRWHISRAVPMRNDDGEILLWIGSSTDVDDMKAVQKALEDREEMLAQLNLELQQARDTAVAASAAKSIFLASMSHELRTPLNAIIGYSEMLRDELMDAEENRMADDLNKILLSGQHLLAVISDILDISKIEAGKLDFELETFDIHEVVREAISMVEPLVLKNQNQLKFSIIGQPVLPITSDRVRIRQVLFNLLSNAAKFTADGQIAVQCQVVADDTGLPMVELVVADSGIGIAKDKLGLVFQQFSQLEKGTYRVFGGTGLGLAISRRICQLLGGTVQVDSELGRGSIFSVTLPLRYAGPVSAGAGDGPARTDIPDGA